MKLVAKLKRRPLISAMVASGILAVATGTAFAIISSAVADRVNVPGTQLPARQLHSSSGFRSISGMTQVIGGRIPLWMYKDGTGPYTESGLGFIGSLQQGFVLNSAIKRYGTLNKGLILPVPLKFAKLHPGPAEVFDMVWAFSGPQAPHMLLHSAIFMDTAVAGITPIAALTRKNMLAWTIDSAANDGLKEIRIALVRGDHLIEVNVAGARLTQSEAYSLVARAGH